MIYRILQDKILSSLKKNKKSILLLGPRQMGKSTLMKNLRPDLVINLAREKEYREHISDFLFQDCRLKHLELLQGINFYNFYLKFLILPQL